MRNAAYEDTIAGLFPGKVAATIFSLKIMFKKETQDLFSCQRSENTPEDLTFEHYA